VVYAGGRRFPVWARVRVRVSVSAAVALRDLRAGERLDTAMFRVETRSAVMSSGLFPASAAEAAGKRLRRPVRAGAAIPAAWLERPPDVIRGDRVHVEVQSGAARLAFEGEAQGSGSAGQTIPVLNPETGKRFPARIEGPGRVEVAGVL
jgi:flagella basal body P-ring formation protein FlgA